jgi:hypothetical protein
MLFATAMAMQACHRSAARGSPAAGASLPVVRPDGGGLLLTWIDDKGDFHVETRVADVPLMGRDIVRVEAENGDNASSPDQVVIVDLREVGVDGGYPVRTMARSEFESIAVARRAKSGPTLAGGGAPPVPELDAAASAQEAPDKPPSGVAVIIYGAHAMRPPATCVTRGLHTSRRTSKRTRTPRTKCNRSWPRAAFAADPSPSSMSGAR